MLNSKPLWCQVRPQMSDIDLTALIFFDDIPPAVRVTTECSSCKGLHIIVESDGTVDQKPSHLLSIPPFDKAFISLSFPACRKAMAKQDASRPLTLGIFF